jgi:hypothetical protein
MKRQLDIQLQERDEKSRLKKYEDVHEAKFIKKDVEEYITVEHHKKKEYESKVKGF